MTVSAGTTKITQNCNGTLTDFDFSFAIYKEEDVIIILKHIATEAETILVLNTDYTIASDNFTDGGTVSTIKEIDAEIVPYAWSADYSITIMLGLALVQETDLLYGGNFSSEAIELIGDRLTRITQQLDEKINRTLKLRKTSALNNIEIDDLEAGKFIMVNAAGDALEMGDAGNGGEALVSNDPYDKDSWNNNAAIAPSQNAVRDELFDNRFTKGATYSMILGLGTGSFLGLPVSNEAYGATWNGQVKIAPSQDAVYDKIESIGAGAGDVVGPATNTDDYVPQWNGADSKTLRNGFPVTLKGKELINNSNVAAMRTTLELDSAALRASENTLTDGSNLPDGHAIKAYGDANWGGGAGDVVGPASATNNAIPLFDGTTGKLIKNSLTTMDAAGAPTFPNNTALRWKQVGGAVKNVLAYDILDNIIIGVDGDDAHVFIERLDTSSVGAPLQSSRMFKLAANYWKTAAEHQRMGMIWHEMINDNPMSRLHFEVGEEDAETKVMSLENDNGTLLAIFQGNVKIEGGSPGINKVLTSDADGLATWTAPAGGGDVSGPATNTDDYVPQWNGADSKLLKNGFAITAAGKAILDDTSSAAQRTTLGLASAALRVAEDALTDGSDLPDGHAIKVYGDANWGGAGDGDVVGPAAHAASYVPQWNTTPNSKTLIEGFLITALGKSLLSDVTAAAMRSTLGLGSVATRIVRDTLMVDDETIPDGDAIIAYGDANWGGGGGLWTDYSGVDPVDNYIQPDNQSNLYIFDPGYDVDLLINKSVTGSGTTGYKTAQFNLINSGSGGWCFPVFSYMEHRSTSGLGSGALYGKTHVPSSGSGTGWCCGIHGEIQYREKACTAIAGNFEIWNKNATINDNVGPFGVVSTIAASTYGGQSAYLVNSGNPYSKYWKYGIHFRAGTVNISDTNAAHIYSAVQLKLNAANGAQSIYIKAANIMPKGVSTCTIGTTSDPFYEIYGWKGLFKNIECYGAVRGDVGKTGWRFVNGFFDNLYISCGAVTCDYVLENNYDLLSLNKLDAHIKKHHSLPNMTTNTDRNDLDLGRASEELLVKTEEQTLYILQLHKRIEKLEKKNGHRL